MPAVKNVGEPCAGEPHARFDGGREETSANGSVRPRARRLPPTRPSSKVSEVRLNQTLFAEYPALKPYIEQLHEEKAQQSPETLARIWGNTVEEATEVAEQLVEVGFFEKRGTKQSPSYWVPFLYRDALSLVQGEAK
jgi:hypothetical protein